MNFLKIAYISYYDFSLDTAATEHIIQTVEGLSRLGHKIWLFAPSFGRREFSANIQAVLVPRSNVLLFDSAVARALRKSKVEFDIVYLRDYMGASRAVKYAVENNFPLVIEHNGLMYAETPLVSSMAQKILLWLDDRSRLKRRLLKADINIVVTEEIGKFFVKKFGIAREKLVHIPNGVDIARFKPCDDKTALRKKLGLNPPDAFWLGYIGSMYPWHILDVVISAFEQIAKRRNDVRLFIGGRGQELEKITALINRSDFKNYIYLKSPLPIEESDLYISSMDVNIALMSPSVAPYCWQVKVNHSGACGVPSVITYDKQFKKLFDAGVAVPAKELSPVGVAKTFEELLDRKKLNEMSVKMRSFVEKNLSWDKIVEEIEKVIKSAIRRKKIGQN